MVNITKSFIFIIIFLLFIPSIFGCGEKKRGRKARFETEQVRQKDKQSLADNYSKIDKACNRLDITVDTLTITDSVNIIITRNEINKLRVEAKDISSDYESAKISDDIQKQLADAGLDYLLINRLSSRIENINEKFIRKFGNN